MLGKKKIDKVIKKSTKGDIVVSVDMSFEDAIKKIVADANEKMKQKHKKPL